MEENMEFLWSLKKELQDRILSLGWDDFVKPNIAVANDEEFLDRLTFIERAMYTVIEEIEEDYFLIKDAANEAFAEVIDNGGTDKEATIECEAQFEALGGMDVLASAESLKIALFSKLIDRLGTDCPLGIRKGFKVVRIPMSGNEAIIAEGELERERIKFSFMPIPIWTEEYEKMGCVFPKRVILN